MQKLVGAGALTCVGWKVPNSMSLIALGIQPPEASWGNMLFNAQTYFFHSPWLAVIPGLAIAITVVSANLLGNALRDALDPRLGRR